MAQYFSADAFVALTLRRRPGDALRLHNLSNLAVTAKVKTVVTNDVLYHMPSWRILQDVVSCIRLNCTIDELGFRRERYADRHLEQHNEMIRRFKDYPDAIRCTSMIAERCKFSLDELSYQYPTEICAEGKSALETLINRTWEGARERYSGNIPSNVIKQINHELKLILSLDYAQYFLTVDSIVKFARSKGILCQGRGSAANSAVCYVLGITSIDPTRHNLLFERFISQERNEPPDIDVDFEHERREEVIQWIYETYGRERAALCATVIRYRTRGAIRDVGKALGLSEDITKSLSSQVWAWSSEGVQEKHAQELNLNTLDRRLRLTLALARNLMGTPRHLSQHPGGFVLTNDRLDELVPLEPARMQDRQIIEWDKDDIDVLKFMKVDVLGLGMATCLRKCFDMLEVSKGIKLELATVPAEDPATYAMIRKADTLGTFQIESRAQMASLPKTKPTTFYDLVVQVALVRPGPIQGNMVHPYLKRKNGLEKVVYPTEELKAVLGKTLGVPLFQEQAMQVAIVCAGFTPGEADQLRRAMATFKFTGGVSHFRDKLINGMVAKGYTLEFATTTFNQLQGFGSYGFPESHAASFALFAYASAWLKCHHPDVFCAALLNSQPMGFYAAAQIVRDAKEHGVIVKPVCINASHWDTTLEHMSEKYLTVRLGMRLVKGLRNSDAARIVAARADVSFTSIEDVWRRAIVSSKSLKDLAEADVFLPSLELARREALWAIRALRDEPLPLFASADRQPNMNHPEIIETPIDLKPMTEGHEVVEDYHHIGMTLRKHPVTFLRESLSQWKMVTCNTANRQRNKSFVHCAGLVLVRQRPGSAKGVMFITIEDESAACNVVVWPSIYEKYRRIIFTAGMIAMKGYIQREGEVVHLIAKELFDLSKELAAIGKKETAFPDSCYTR